MPKAPDLSHIAAPLRGLAVPIKKLTLDPANARQHGKRNLETIAGNLKRFGQRLPIIVQKEGMVVRAGNGRVLAAKELGWTHMAALVVEESDVESTAYAIADNRTSDLAEWDDNALARLLQSLPDELRAAAGFSEAEAARAMRGLDAGIEEDEAPKPLKKAVTNKGDLWELGPHRLLCGSSTESKDVQRLMGEERARLFATDPPYLVNYDGTNYYFNPKKGQKKSDVNKDWSQQYGCSNWDDADGSPDLYDGFIGAAAAHAIKPDAAWYCWHASVRGAMLEAMWAKHGAFVHQQIIWAKNRPILSRAWYMWQHEPCFMGWVRPHKPKRMDGTSLPGVWDDTEQPLEDLTKDELLKLLQRATTLWRCAGRNEEEAGKAEHPTEKPVEVFARPMRQHTRRGDICYEPFSGSGTQISAAEQLGRRCFAIEIEPIFVDVAIRRWQKLTGKEATLEGTKRTWTQVAKARKRSTEPVP